jgi:hypothetical protein
MSTAKLEATKDTGLARGGRDGLTYVTNDVYYTADSARQALALPQTPEVRVTLGVQAGVFSPPSVVKSDFG